MTPFQKLNYDLGQQQAMQAVGLNDANAFVSFVEQDHTEKALDATRQEKEKQEESPPHWSGGAALESTSDRSNPTFIGGGSV